MQFASQGRIVLDGALLLGAGSRTRGKASNFLNRSLVRPRKFSSVAATSSTAAFSNNRQNKSCQSPFRSGFNYALVAFSSSANPPGQGNPLVPTDKLALPAKVNSNERLLGKSPRYHDNTRDSAFKQKVNKALLKATQNALEQRRQMSDGDEKKVKDRPRVKPLRMRVPNYGPDADMAVQSLQNARKERARAKTAANVRRALYGNTVICFAKLGAWVSSGSSAMMSEFVHSVVDCGNQALLLMGLRDSKNAADRLHPYGYGKSVYFWALVSALGTFFLGAGVSMSHSIGELMNPSLQEINNEVWAVLALSLVVDGYVLYETFKDVLETKPHHVSLWDHISNLRDPATMAVLLEDGAACLGIVMAIAGIGAAHYTGMPVFDGITGVGVSCLLGGMGLALVRVNHRFLLGHGIDRDMSDTIEQIILSRRSIDNVYQVQSQWTGPETFSFKAEVDFDGTYLAAQLMPRYRGEFEKASENLNQELEVLLCWYAEDVMRAVEREVRHIEAMIRQKYPGAEYIELEPMSTDADRFAIDDSFEEKLLRVEREDVKRLIRVLYEPNESRGDPSSLEYGSLEGKGKDDVATEPPNKEK